MKIADFYREVAARDGVADVPPADAVRAVFGALVARLDDDEVDRLRQELPPALAKLVPSAAGGHAFDRDDFLEDVASRLDIDDADAEDIVHAVLHGLRDAIEPYVSPEQVFEALPTDLASLVHDSL